MVYIRKLEITAGLIDQRPLICKASSNPEDRYCTWIDEDGALNFSEHGPQGFDALFFTRSQRFGYQNDEALELEAPARNAALTLKEELDIDADIPLPKARRVDKEIVADKKSSRNIAKLNFGQFQKYNHIKVEGDD